MLAVCSQGSSADVVVSRFPAKLQLCDDVRSSARMVMPSSSVGSNRRAIENVVSMAIGVSALQMQFSWCSAGTVVVKQWLPASMDDGGGHGARGETRISHGRDEDFDVAPFSWLSPRVIL